MLVEGVKENDRVVEDMGKKLKKNSKVCCSVLIFLL